MLIDTHCHLNFKDYDNDREQIIGRCLDNNVWIINVGVNKETSRQVIELAEKYKEGVYASIAVHPHNIDKEEFKSEEYKKLAKNKKVVAIGETGLDYMFCENNKEQQELQKEIFIKHIKLAHQIDKPLIIHSRRLFPEILEIIKDNKQHNPRGVLHCYMGRWSYAKEYLDLGFYISFTGLITYARDYDKVIRNTPLDRILIETDAPYLSPEPYRNKRNNPIYVKHVAEQIAKTKEVSFEKVAEQTTKNAKELFKI
ncbi:MAG: YchF/TatD family DNA exonuclease [Candidatus Portnoybacteria bacterium]|nr:YchF/TatD family DNA exonuclease [Candidatus Portnoybacteria bacterium]